MKTQRNSQGMTLVEVMIVVAIIAVLAAVAYPSYIEQMRKTRRSDAITALSDLASRQENYFVESNQYANKLAGDDQNSLIKFASGQTTKYGFEKSGDDLISKDGYYKLTVSTNTERTQFTLTATVIDTSQQGDDTKCKKLTMDHTSKKEAENAAGNPSDYCW